MTLKNHNTTSLKQKVILLFSLPTLLATAMTVSWTRTCWEARHNANVSISTLGAISDISKVVHEAQKERGMSATFLGGAISLDKLREQRERTSQALALLESHPETGGIVRETANQLDPIRAKVDQKLITKQETIAAFSVVVQRLLKDEQRLAPALKDAQLALASKTLAIIEDAKEGAGLLRAQITGALTGPKPVENETATKLQQLKYTVDSRLRSPGLQLSEDSKRRISDFLSSREWREVHDIVTRRTYDLDPNAFFMMITKAIDSFVPMVQEQIEESQANARSVYTDRTRNLMIYGGGSALILIIILIAGTLVTRNLLTQLMVMSNNLLESNNFIHQESTGLSALSAQLVESVAKEAAFLQRTASAAEEISSMVKRTSENTVSSKVAVDQCVKVADRGQQVVASMGAVADQMANLNQNVLEGISGNNQQLEKIVTLFKQIEDKTKVIHDIVFQTKLLAFNASVEAARAGEHGKGFAVVAEEVGRLAQMSGSSAAEIGTQIQSAAKEISSIISTAKDRTSHMSDSLKSKTEELVDKVRICSSSFEEISSSVASIAGMIGDITNAANEQANGVGEINQALTEAERLSASNSQSASAVDVAATSLRSQMNYLKTSIRSLSTLLSGKSFEDPEGESLEPMPEFVWGKTLTLGVPEMDEEHQILVSKINALIRSLNNGKNKQENLTAFKAMAAYVVEHFADEEALMARVSYPQLKAHQEVHRRLLQQAGEFQRAIEINTLNHNELRLFLQEWLISHIKGTDAKYVASYQQQQKKSFAA